MRRLVAATLVFIVHSQAGGPGWCQVPPFLPDIAAYLDIVATYRGAQPEKAVEAIRAWTPDRLERTVRELPDAVGPRLGACQDRPERVTFTVLDAAVMLHTHAAAAALEEADSHEASRHFNHAQMILEWTSRRRPAAGRLAGPAAEPCDAPPPISRREWYLAATRLALAEWVLSGAEEFAIRLLRAAPDDPDALFAAGNVQEALATSEAQQYLPRPTGRYSNNSTWMRAQRRYLESLRNRERYLGAALQLYARALTRASGRQDIRLRFGWVSVLLDRDGDARPALESVAENPDSRANQYLAALFLGRLHQRAGRLDAAARAYRHAAGLLPDAHVARIALSHVLGRQGVMDESLAEALRVLEPPGPSAERDPWTDYPHGDWAAGVRLLDQLRLRISDRAGSTR